MFRRITLVVVVILTTGLLTLGCGSGALTPPGQESPSETITDVEPTTAEVTAATTTTGVTAKPGPTTTARQSTASQRYPWKLPTGPSSPVTNEDVIYQPLTRNECAYAQQRLDEYWNGLQTPRNPPLYQAAIELCKGRAPQAKQMFARASRFGWAMDEGPGSTGAVDCATYRAVRSVLEQRAPDTIGCQRGEPPEWPTDDPYRRDDPRTDAVEGTTPTTTTTTTTSAARSTTTTSPSG
jgi:hypothetical protein